MHGSRFFALLTVGLVACGGNYGRIAGPAAVDSLGIRSVTPAEPAIDTSNGVVYVSSEDTDIVILFALQGANLNPIGSIVVGIDAPVGMTVDASGKLYVANFGNGTVSVYPKGKVTPSLILSNGLIGPRRRGACRWYRVCQQQSKHDGCRIPSR
jgi:DNA-binding beta-propeller fold protein YncE